MEQQTLTKNQFSVMFHTIGLGKIESRNWFGTGKNGKDYEDLKILEELGFAKSNKAPEWLGDEVLFCLTDEGKKVANKEFEKRKPVVKKLTRGQKTYQDYLKVSDCYESFAHFIGADKETVKWRKERYLYEVGIFGEVLT